MRILSLVAEEMWVQETRELDRETVLEVAELAADDLGTPPQSISILRNKIGSHAMFSSDRENLRISFNHEYFFAFFLARAIVGALHSGEPLDHILGRATMSSVLTQELVANLTQTECAVVAKALSVPRRFSLTRETVARNFGAIVAEGFKQKKIASPSKVAYATFFTIDFSGQTLDETKFVECVFSSCRFAGMSIIDCAFDRCIFDGVEVSPSTVFQNCRAENCSWQSLIQTHEDADSRSDFQIRAYNPSAIARLLNQVGLNIGDDSENEPEIPEETMKLAGRFLSMMRTQTMFSGDDIRNRSLHKNSKWEDFLEILVQTGIVEKENISKQKGGSGPAVYKLQYRPTDIEAGEVSESTHADIAEFWQRLRSL